MLVKGTPCGYVCVSSLPVLLPMSMSSPCQNKRMYTRTEARSVAPRKASSYTLSREYRVVRNRYSRLLFTSEDRLCANLRVQEQSTNMTS